MPSTTTSVSASRVEELLKTLDEATHRALSVSNDIRIELTQALANEEKSQRLCDDLKKQKEQLIQEKKQLTTELEQSIREVERLKATNEKAEVTIVHHTETLTQTRREVQWWKERAEEWKDEFKRADEERHKLLARVDELVAQQLNMNRHALYQQEPLTPRSQHAYNGDATSPSMSADRGSSSYSASAHASASTSRWMNGDVASRQTNGTRAISNTMHKAYNDVPRTHHTRMLTPGPGKSGLSLPTGPTTSKNAKYTLAQTLPQPQPKSRLIRRVHAVVESVVKDEDDEDEEQLLRQLAQSPSPESNSGGSWVDASFTKSSLTEKGSVSTRSARMVNNDVKMPITRLHYPNEKPFTIDDDEDELTLGMEDNLNEIYGTNKGLVTNLASSIHDPSHSSPNSAGKKRKLVSGSESGKSTRKSMRR